MRAADAARRALQHGLDEPVLEARRELDLELHLAGQPLDDPDQRVGVGRADVVAAGPEAQRQRVAQTHPATGGLEDGVQDEGVGPVAARRREPAGGADRPVAGIGIEQPGEAARRVEAPRTPPLDRPARSTIAAPRQSESSARSAIDGSIRPVMSPAAVGLMPAPIRVAPFRARPILTRACRADPLTASDRAQGFAELRCRLDLTCACTPGCSRQARKGAVKAMRADRALGRAAVTGISRERRSSAPMWCARSTTSRPCDAVRNGHPDLPSPA